MNGMDTIAGSGSELQHTPKNILVTGGAGFMYGWVDMRGKGLTTHYSS